MTDPFADELIALLPRLRRFALALARAPDAADDLVQTTCERALSNRAGFVEGTRMDAWLFRILRNAFIDRHRRTRTEGVRVDIDDAPELAAEGAERAADLAIEVRDAADAIDRLPDDQREILLLVCVEELSYREAADVLGVPIGTVMSRLARARRRLADLLGIDGSPVRSKGGKRTEE